MKNRYGVTPWAVGLLMYLTVIGWERVLTEAEDTPMLSGKQDLADMTVASGESWIAKMSHDELKSLFELKCN